jgi:hypothetical protein
MLYDNLSCVSQNVLKFYQQLTGEERRIPFIFDDFHFCRSRVIGLDMTENRIFTLCRMVTWRTYKNPIFCHIKSNNSGTAKVKIVKNERDLPFFTGKLLIKFQNILKHTTQVTIRHRVKILFSVISSPITLERQKWNSETTRPFEV